MTSRWIALAIVSAVAVVAAEPQERRFQSDDAGGVAVCRTYTADGGHTLLSPASTVRCPTDATQIKCDFSRAEPMDLPSEAICGAAPIQFVQAEPVAVDSSGRTGPLSVQWLRIGKSGELTRTATRSFDGQAPLLLHVATDSRSILRFLSDVHSPVSMSAAQLRARPPARLPPSTPGGELFVVVQPVTVAPVALSVIDDMGRTREVPLIDEVTSVPGLRPGRYRLLPTFRGGLNGPGAHVEILDNQTADVVVPRSAVGAVSVFAVPGICGHVTGIKLWMTMQTAEDPTSAVTSRKIVVSGQLDECVATFGGVPPGDYDLEVLGRDGRLALYRLTVTEQEVTPVTIEEATAHVTGRVRLNGRPLGGGSVEFRRSTPATRGKSSLVVPTDAQGVYYASLGSPGTFSVRFRLGKWPLFGQEKVGVFESGWATSDWDLEGGMVSIGIKGWDRSSDVTVTMVAIPTAPLSPGASRMVSADRPVGITDELPVRIAGLADGAYEVRAIQQGAGSGRKVSRTKTFKLGGLNRDVVVDLDLVDNHSTITLQDEQRTLVAGALIAGASGAVAEVSPGRFDLVGVSPGAELRIRAPGFTPVCRIAPEAGDVVIELHPGRTVELQFGERLPLDFPAAKLHIPGSDCPMYIWDLPYSTMPTAGDRGSRFVFSNFPMSGVVELMPEQGGTRHVIPAEGNIVIVKSP